MLRLQIAQEFRYGLGCMVQNPFYLLSQQGQEVIFTYLRWGSEWIQRHSLKGRGGSVNGKISKVLSVLCLGLAGKENRVSRWDAGHHEQIQNIMRTEPNCYKL